MKVNVVYDTVEKTMSVYLDGKQMEDVMCVGFDHVYSMDNDGYTGKFRMSVTSAKKNENGTSEMYRVSASEQGEIVPYVEPKTVNDEIAKFLLRG